MSGDPYRKAIPGERLKIPARAWNRLMDGVGVTPGATGEPLSSDTGPYTWVYAYNRISVESLSSPFGQNFSSNVERGDVVSFPSANQSIESPELSMTSTSGAFFVRPVVAAALAFNETEVAGIALDPLPRMAPPDYRRTIGRVAITGVVQAKVKKTADGGRFAALDGGKPGGLCTSWWKGYRIFAMQPGNVGETLAAIIDMSTYHVEQIVYGTTVGDVSYPLPPELDGNPVVDLNRPARFGGQATTVRVPVKNAFASVVANVKVVLHQTLQSTPNSVFTIIGSEFKSVNATNGGAPVRFQAPKD